MISFKVFCFLKVAWFAEHHASIDPDLPITTWLLCLEKFSLMSKAFVLVVILGEDSYFSIAEIWWLIFFLLFSSDYIKSKNFKFVPFFEIFPWFAASSQESFSESITKELCTERIIWVGVLKNLTGWLIFWPKIVDSSSFSHSSFLIVIHSSSCECFASDLLLATYYEVVWSSLSIAREDRKDAIFGSCYSSPTASFQSEELLDCAM